MRYDIRHGGRLNPNLVEEIEVPHGRIKVIYPLVRDIWYQSRLKRTGTVDIPVA